MNNSILIVEDNEQMQKMIATVIKSNFDRDVLTANSGIEALKIIKTKSPELILMDINLEDDKDGIDYFIEIRKEKLVDVIYMTAFNNKEIIKKAKATNPAGFLLKPFTNQQLILTIEMCLNRIDADRMLDKKEQDLQLIFNNIGEIILICDEENCIIDVNDAAVRELEYTRNELIGSSSAKFMDDRNIDKYFSALTKINDTGKTIMETQLISKSGKLIPFETSLTLTFFKGKKIKMCVGRNLIERKIAESRNVALINKLRLQQHELKDQNEKLNNSHLEIEFQKLQLDDLFENAPLGYIILDENGNIKKVNTTAEKILHLTHHQLISKSFATLLPEDQRNAFFENLTNSITKHQKQEAEFALRLKNGGKQVWIEMVFTPDNSAQNKAARCALLDITNAKYFRDELKKSEIKLNKYYNNTPVMLHSINTKGELIDVSDYWLQYLGYSRDEVIGHPSTEFLTNKSQNEANSHYLKDFFKTGIARDIPYEMVKKNGEIINVLMSANALRNDKGEIERSLAVMTDITEQVNAEKQLRKALERFEVIFNQSMVGVLIVDENRNIVQTNDEFNMIFGYTPEELKGQTIEIIHENKERYENFGEVYFSKLAQNSFVNILYKLKKKDGTIVHCRISGKAINPADIHEGVIWVIDDITQQLKAQELIRNNEMKFRNLTENLNDIVLIIDKEFKINFSTQTIRKLLGYDPDIIKGKHIMELVGKDHHDDLADGFDKILENCCGKFNIDIELIDSENELRNFECLITNLIDDETIQGMVLIAHDITKRLNTQSELDKMVSVLELKNLDLNVLNKELNEANATKDKFFSIIAHDLKTPFNTLVGYSDLLVEDYDEFDNAEKFAMVKKIYNSAISALKLLENLLEWSRLQRGKMDFYPEKIDIKILYTQILELIAPSAEKKQISIEANIPENIWANIDKYMIATVLRNILSNAIKFTERYGKVQIVIKDQHPIILVEISDNGRGMTQKQQSQLFILESNYSTSGTEGEVGTGLGLILCKEFVEMHKGKIWVESEPGNGSTFSFTIPKWRNPKI